MMRQFVLFLVLMIITSACMSSEPSVRLKGERFNVELALTPEDQALGVNVS